MGTTSAFQFSCGLALAVAVLVAFLCGSGPVEASSCGELVARTSPSQVEPNFSHNAVAFKVSLSEALTVNNLTLFLDASAGIPDTMNLYTLGANGEPYAAACSQGCTPTLVPGSSNVVGCSFGTCALSAGTYWVVTRFDNAYSSWIMVPWSPLSPTPSVSIVTSWAVQDNDWADSGSGKVPAVAIMGCASILAPSPAVSSSASPIPSTTPTASPTPSITPTSSRQPSFTATFSPSPTRSGSRAPSASATPYPSGNLVSSRSPSPFLSPSSLPSLVPSPSPALVSVTNLTAGFDDTLATFNITGTVVGAGSNSSSSVRESANVVSKFNGLQLGNLSVPADSLSGLARTVVNGSASETTYVYSASVGGSGGGGNGSTQFDQSFTFYERATTAVFAGVTFDIAANSVKWSLNFTTSGSGSASHTTQWSTVRYRLAGLLQSSSGADNATTLSAATDRPITSRANTPAAGLTSYYVPLFVSDTKTRSTTVSIVTATVVLFDVAIVDGSSASIRHAITAVAVNGSAAASATEYEVVLEFPPFERSVFYDPSIGLGVLLGSKDDGSGGVGGDSSNVGLIVGVAVAIPVAVVVVAVAIGVGVFVTWRRRRSDDSSRAINFSVDDRDHDLDL